MSFRAKEYEDGSMVVNEGDIVIVSDTSKKNDGVFAKVGICELVGGKALVGLHPVIEDKNRHKSLVGGLSPSTSPHTKVVLEGKTGDFKEGDFSAHVPNKVDQIRYKVGKKMLGW